LLVVSQSILGESFPFEFKKEFTAELKKEVVAFANTNEGTIYIGIDDFGNIIGIKNVDEVLNQVVLSIRNSIKPDITMYCNSKIERIENKDVIKYENKVVGYKPFVYIMMNKPAGVISATEDNCHKTVIDLLNDEYRTYDIFPAGRLDIDTEGLLLLTNDGELFNRVVHPKSEIYKKYACRCKWYKSSIITS